MSRSFKSWLEYPRERDFGTVAVSKEGINLATRHCTQYHESERYSFLDIPAFDRQPDS